MSAEQLHPVPSWRTVASEQLRMLTLLQRRDFIAIALIGGFLVALGLYGLLRVQFVGSINGPSELDVIRGFRFPLGLVGALWPLGVWRHGTPAQRGYFWALPVARGPHTLLRVGLGWLLLMGVSLAVMVVGALMMAAYTAKLGLPVVFSSWYAPLIAATLSYFLVSAFVVQLDSPVRWVIWCVLAVFGLRLIAVAASLRTLANTIDFVIHSLRLALAGPLGGQPWAASYAIWLILAAVAVVFGAFRHQES